MNDHYVICGFGATGRSAATDLISRGVLAQQIVVVDAHEDAVSEANLMGLVGVHGDASQSVVLRQVAITDAKAVIVTPNRDDTAVLITLTARELNPDAHIVASGREQENLHLLRQGGADEVIDATAAVGRMLGLGTFAPGAVGVFEDLLNASDGLELAEVAPDTSSGTPSVPLDSSLVVVLRDGLRLRPDQVDQIMADDRLVVLIGSSI